MPLEMVNQLGDENPRLEICVDSIESALAAIEGGANRIELCSALSEGGLTPSYGVLKTLKSNLNFNIPIFCMLRPRRGNDFNYRNEEIQAILYDMEIFQQIGCDGFVFGSLNDNQEINIKQCKQIIENSFNLPVTFHRAFDLTKKEKMYETCELIKSLGFQRILTSGFEKSAEDGLDNLKNLINKYNKDIIIMPGAGITCKNLSKILKETKCQEFHASAKIQKIQKSCNNSNVSMGNVNDEEIFVTDSSIVRDLMKIAKF